MFTLDETVRALTGRKIDNCTLSFSEAVVDSRAVTKGMLFAAIPGEFTDGHKFVGSAFASGASAALIQEDVEGDYDILDLRGQGQQSFSFTGKPLCLRVENTVEALQKIAAFHREQLSRMEVIGITGTVGKTSTKELIYDVLSQRYRTLKTLGNMNNEIGLPLTLLRADEQTEQAILEMGFYVPGEIDQLCRIAAPSVGVITNVGMVHASRAGSMEVIAKGKSELVQALPAGGTVILNYDDPYVKAMAEISRAEVLYYGLDPRADLCADEIESHGLDGIEFTMHYHGEKHHVKSPLTGRHSVMTALRAAAVGLAKNLTWEEISYALGHSKNQIRMRITRASGGAVIIDDTYNASPESTIAALNLLSEMKGKKIAVLGEMKELGQYEKKGHEMVGKRAAEVCDELITVGPVTEYLLNAAAAAGFPKEKTRRFETAAESIPFLLENFGNNQEIILIKGSRSMRMEQIVSALEGKQ